MEVDNTEPSVYITTPTKSFPRCVVSTPLNMEEKKQNKTLWPRYYANHVELPLVLSMVV